MATTAPINHTAVRAMGIAALGSSPEQFDVFLSAEVGKWGKVIRDAKVPLAD